MKQECLIRTHLNNIIVLFPYDVKYNLGFCNSFYNEYNSFLQSHYASVIKRSKSATNKETEFISKKLLDEYDIILIPIKYINKAKHLNSYTKYKNNKD